MGNIIGTGVELFSEEVRLGKIDPGTFGHQDNGALKDEAATMLRSISKEDQANQLVGGVGIKGREALWLRDG